MTTNPTAKNILFYGDSLVYGKKPLIPERFPADIRFSGILQNVLGSEFNIIEEGLRARNLVGENPAFPDRDGLKTFGPIFGSHVPLDLVMIMLGTNDCNRSPERTKEELSATIANYSAKIGEWLKQLGIPTIPKLLIIAPPHIKGAELDQNENLKKIFGPDAEERSKKLAPIYREFCQTNNIAFFDAATICEAAPKEGIHLDEENNRKLGEALAEEVRRIL